MTVIGVTWIWYRYHCHNTAVSWHINITRYISVSVTTWHIVTQFGVKYEMLQRSSFYVNISDQIFQRWEMKLSNYKLDDTLQAVFGDVKIGPTRTFSLIEQTTQPKTYPGYWQCKRNTFMISFISIMFWLKKNWKDHNIRSVDLTNCIWDKINNKVQKVFYCSKYFQLFLLSAGFFLGNLSHHSPTSLGTEVETVLVST